MKRLPPALRKKAEKIKLVLFDVDGVLTDGAIIIDDKGVETKRFHVRDGHGITMLKRCGIEVGFITGRSSNVVRLRAKELGVRLVYQGIHNKAHAYTAIKRKTGLRDEEIAYVGDDAVDLPILQQSGLAVAVQDCWPGLKGRVDYVTEAGGGNGAVREVSELLLKTRASGQDSPELDGVPERNSS
jgi:3-deoxy-D-manno-octulosonate 8-phosphate phosphatase (KDO 8-P phosphatase)